MGKSAEKIGALDAWYEHSLLVASATKRSVGRRWPELRTFDGYSHESEDRDDDCAVDLLELPFMLLCLLAIEAQRCGCGVPCHQTLQVLVDEATVPQAVKDRDNSSEGSTAEDQGVAELEAHAWHGNVAANHPNAGDPIGRQVRKLQEEGADKLDRLRHQNC